MKQLVARVGINDVHQRFATMANRFNVRAFKHLADLVPEQRNILGCFAVGGGRKQSDEPAFTTGLAFFVVNLDTDIVQVGTTVNRRARIGFRQNQPVARTPKPAHLSRQLDSLALALLARQQAERATLDWSEEDLAVAVA